MSPAARGVDPRKLVLGSFRAALAGADPLKLVPGHLPHPPRGRTLVAGAGKAGAAMALAVEQHWPAQAPLSGLVITRYQHALPTQRIEVVEAGHPVPDTAGRQAASRLMHAARLLTEEDLLLVLLSGGGSSLLSAPAEGLADEDIKVVTKQLLKSGSPIQDINTVRKHLSVIQGGQLAAATRAPVLTLIISDVTGDDPTHVASGPCAADPTTYGEALAVLRRYRIVPSPAIATHLQKGVDGLIAETPKPGDVRLAQSENRVIATARQALQSAADYLAEQDVPTAVLSDSITGEAREVAKVHAALARQIRLHGEPWRPPVALISGGECTVTVRGEGYGGRCSEFLLSLAIELAGTPGISALACDTDGIDGSENNAGAVLTPDSWQRALRAGLCGADLLAENNAHAFFSALGDLVITGPTRTNVNDYRVILIS